MGCAGNATFAINDLPWSRDLLRVSGTFICWGMDRIDVFADGCGFNPFATITGSCAVGEGRGALITGVANNDAIVGGAGASIVGGAGAAIIAGAGAAIIGGAGASTGATTDNDDVLGCDCSACIGGATTADCVISGNVGVDCAAAAILACKVLSSSAVGSARLTYGVRFLLKSTMTNASSVLKPTRFGNKYITNPRNANPIKNSNKYICYLGASKS